MTSTERGINFGNAFHEGLMAGIAAGIEVEKQNRNKNRRFRQEMRRIIDQGNKWCALIKELQAEEKASTAIQERMWRDE